MSTAEAQHRHLISDLEDQIAPPTWPWIVGWVLMIVFAAACGMMLAGGSADDPGFAPLWAGIFGAISLVLVIAMSLALREERADRRASDRRMIHALRAAYGVSQPRSERRRGAD